jgi:DNA invertase Pin-like site-specific DNA recombinase
VDFVAADMPQANRLTIGIMAVMAQHEREMISERTKARARGAKRRGVKLGGFRGVRFTANHVKLAVAAKQEKARARVTDLVPIVQELQAAGCESLRAIAAGLEERGIPAARGGKWSAVQVSRLLEAASIPFQVANVGVA